MAIRHNLSSAREVREILIADIVLILAFSLTITGGITAFTSNYGSALHTFLYYLPIAALGVSLSFILHELMHKFMAQRYGAIAEFRTSFIGLGITIASAAFGFLLGIPGATMIYTNRFTDKENGIVSLVGPLTNFVVFGFFAILGFLLFGIGFFTGKVPVNSYAATAISFVIYISILLAFFNMLPIFPLDGSKVLRWNKIVYAVTMLAIFILLLIFTNIPLLDIVLLVIIALIFSLFYKVAL